MFLFPLSYSRPFFSKPPILNKDLHIFVSAEFWRGDRMLFICPGALKNKSRGQRSGRGEETRLWIKVFAKINEVLRSGQVSRVLFGGWEAFFGVQERYNFGCLTWDTILYYHILIKVGEACRLDLNRQCPPPEPKQIQKKVFSIFSLKTCAKTLQDFLCGFPFISQQ